MTERLQFKSDSVLSTLESHVSIREYIDKEIDNELLRKLINASRRSPTSSNMQAYSFVVVKDQEKKEVLSKLAGDQKHIRTCGAFVAVCADISRLDKAVELHEKSLAKNLENMLVSSVDAALVGMSLSIAAESVGLGTCMIGGIRNNPKEVAKVLGLPNGAYVVFGMTIGWPDWERVKNQKPRLEENVMIHWDEYSDEGVKKELQKYDNQLAEHYRSEGRNSPDAAWTGIIARKFASPRREHLRTELEELGFSFE